MEIFYLLDILVYGIYMCEKNTNLLKNNLKNVYFKSKRFGRISPFTIGILILKKKKAAFTKLTTNLLLL